MSFSGEIKQEIAYNDLKTCCSRAQLSALILMTSSLTFSSGRFELLVRSENPTTAKRVVTLLKKLYSCETELEIAQKTNLKKNNVYNVRVLADGREILEDLGLYGVKGLANHPSYSIVAKDCCARAYLAGCFLAYGACNPPAKTNYHLEIAVGDEEHAQFIVKQLSRFIEGAKVSVRRGHFVVYLKKVDAISDFMRLVGAHESMMKFENARISRDYRNSFVRLDNCEIANEMKAIESARKQLDAIEKIVVSKKYETLSEKLTNVVELRMTNQEASLNELCDIYQKVYGETISKSGMKHRLNKLEEIASKL